jgi:hypothetical protein
MNRKLLLLLIPLILLIGCRRALAPQEAPPPPPTVAPTQPPTPQPGPTVTILPTPELPAIIDDIPTPYPAPLPTNTPEPSFSADVRYQVIFVEADDALNVRAGPGADNPIAAELAPDATGIRVTGPGERVGDWLWLPIQSGAISGWVNSLYLTEMVSDDEFCNDADVLTLLTDLRAAVLHKNGSALTELVHPEHGLTVHRYWWSPAVRFTAVETADLFASDASYYWGQEDGTGFDMNGSFMEYIYPRIERNLLPARVLGCNDIMHGATAGHVWLPEGYENVNFYSLYRPYAEDQFELDWGTWVVGIERWQGRYYISYLVHYEWEI